MKSRVALTAIWLAALVASLAAVELLYVGHKSLDEKFYLAPEERWEAMQPLVTLYTPYLAGILAFWYTKPFRAKRTDAREKVRVGLGVSTSLILNAVVLYFVLRVRLLHPTLAGSEASVLEDIGAGVKLAAALSVLVAPANAYFFGFEPKQ